MDIALGFLTFGTMGFVMVFGYLQSRAMEERMKRGGPKSSLSRDGAAERLAAVRTSENNSSS
jgi:acyl-coenzyme A synthetase/AMP-(fatty) acid ligase